MKLPKRFSRPDRVIADRQACIDRLAQEGAVLSMSTGRDTLPVFITTEFTKEEHELIEDCIPYCVVVCRGQKRLIGISPVRPDGEDKFKKCPDASKATDSLILVYDEDGNAFPSEANRTIVHLKHPPKDVIAQGYDLLARIVHALMGGSGSIQKETTQ